MEEKDEKEIALFQEWLQKNGWEFNESLNAFVNQQKKEFKSNDELLEIYEKEKEEAKKQEAEKHEKQKEVEKAFNEFLNKNGWKLTEEKDLYVNVKGKKKNVMELVEDFKIEIQNNKNKKTETKSSKKSEIPEEIKRYEEKEGIKKMLTHKYKGVVTRHDLNPKNGTMVKRVKLYDENDSLQEDFCFETSYEVK